MENFFSTTGMLVLSGNLLFFRKFVVFFSLLIFIALFSLRLDGVLSTCYWSIFAPLWIWKCLVFIGAGIGLVAWWRHPLNHMDPESYIHFKSMLVSSSMPAVMLDCIPFQYTFFINSIIGLHLLLIFFEVLACDKLQSSRHIWVLVFLPMLLLSLLCIAISIWALKHERSFEVFYDLYISSEMNSNK